MKLQRVTNSPPGLDDRRDKRLCVQLQPPIAFSLEKAQHMIRTVFPEKTPEFQRTMASTLLEKLNVFFEHPSKKEALAIRLHKKTDGLSLWCVEKTDEICITLFQNILNKGDYKKVKEAISFLIPKDPEKLIKSVKTVIYRVKQEDIEEVRKGIEMHRQVFAANTIAAQNYFVSPCVVYPTFHRVNKGETLELQSLRYLQDLSFIVYGLPLNTPSGPRYLTSLEAIRGLKNIALGIEYLIGIGMSHQDIKPNNILIKLDRGQLVWHIFDFDCAVNQLPALVEERESYYLNYAARQGVATQETDCYSLVLLIIEALIPYLTIFVDEDEECDDERLERYQKLTSQQIEISERSQQHFRYEQIKTLKEFLPPESHSLLNPFLYQKECDSIEAKTNLLIYADSLNERGDARGSAAIKNFVTGVYLWDDAFKLLGKVLQVDQAIENILDQPELDSDAASYHEKSDLVCQDAENMMNGEESFENTMIKAMRDHPFPTIGEIKKFLDRCEVILEEIESLILPIKSAIKIEA
ncbi:MAG: hypothetical protein ACH350_00775 [Parachlamydiaceae bacterium]